MTVRGAPFVLWVGLLLSAQLRLGVSTQEHGPSQSKQTTGTDNDGFCAKQEDCQVDDEKQKGRSEPQGQNGGFFPNLPKPPRLPTPAEILQKLPDGPPQLPDLSTVMDKLPKATELLKKLPKAREVLKKVPKLPDFPDPPSLKKFVTAKLKFAPDVSAVQPGIPPYCDGLVLTPRDSFLREVCRKLIGVEVCYGELGCFTTDPPWSLTLERPISSLPRPPEEIQVQFLLRTRNTPSTGEFIRAGDRAALAASDFIGTRPTKFITHGFIENGFVAWITDMSQEILRADDCNVIAVDWGSNGGSMFPYTQATANTQIVGAIVAQMITFLMQETGNSASSYHLIGHSLGSHTMGYAGMRVPGLGRITGLDPAEPYFQGTDPMIRLDPTDAELVDVIHSDGGFFFTSLGYGMYDPTGHLDFYPNGGIEMPGCDEGLTHYIDMNGGIYEGGREYVACNHLKAIVYFHDSINSICPMMAYPCRDYDRFKDGHCLDCRQGCAQMGYHADKYKPAPGLTNLKYYLDTAARSPTCLYHYQVMITLGTDSDAEEVDGYLHLSFVTQSGTVTEYYKLTDDPIKLQPGNSYMYFLKLPTNLGNLQRVRFLWDYDWSIANPSTWFIFSRPKIWMDRIQVMAGESQNRMSFCAFNNYFVEDVASDLRLC
ncbi:PREDICTED: pancreatic triacylglycerol lipase-like isoform X2 [Branchiostoma belcheri]|uniref:Pancreatic triacylglycerol lipase-like isoform X2 n=1 Tax=Branchiostoma belcheri TaxID=7741 RepID=A0A6P4YVA1_BRABE|nr:PREDICTED: pancreatic triacylglycerol lipase-like isoform X2 [Branchiostoma belcheri]